MKQKKATVDHSSKNRKTDKGNLQKNNVKKTKTPNVKLESLGSFIPSPQICFLSNKSEAVTSGKATEKNKNKMCQEGTRNRPKLNLDFLPQKNAKTEEKHNANPAQIPDQSKSPAPIQIQQAGCPQITNIPNVLIFSPRNYLTSMGIKNNAKPLFPMLNCSPKSCPICRKEIKMQSIPSHNLSLKYRATKDSYNLKVINDIVFSANTHIVARFKDFLIYDDPTEFMRRLYSCNESYPRIMSLCEYYERSSKVFPNYIAFPENKYMYKNITRKQKAIDKRHEMEERKEEEKAENSRIFTSNFLKNSGTLMLSKFREDNIGKIDSQLKSYMKSQSSIRNNQADQSNPDNLTRRDLSKMNIPELLKKVIEEDCQRQDTKKKKTKRLGGTPIKITKKTEDQLEITVGRKKIIMEENPLWTKLKETLKSAKKKQTEKKRSRSQPRAKMLQINVGLEVEKSITKQSAQRKALSTKKGRPGEGLLTGNVNEQINRQYATPFPACQEVGHSITHKKTASQQAKPLVISKMTNLLMEKQIQQGKFNMTKKLQEESVKDLQASTKRIVNSRKAEVAKQNFNLLKPVMKNAMKSIRPLARSKTPLQVNTKQKQNNKLLAIDIDTLSKRLKKQKMEFEFNALKTVRAKTIESTSNYRTSTPDELRRSNSNYLNSIREKIGEKKKALMNLAAKSVAATRSTKKIISPRIDEKTCDRTEKLHSNNKINPRSKSNPRIRKLLV